MKKSKIVSLVLLTTLGLYSCQKEAEEDHYFVRGSEEDNYCAVDTNRVHGFRPYYYIRRYYSQPGNRNYSNSVVRGGYESNSIDSKSIKSVASGRYSGYGRANVSRGGFGSSGAHGFAS